MEPISKQWNAILWAIVGLGAAIAIQLAQARFYGDWSGLLAVGETSVMRPAIEQHLPGLVVTAGGGHDGQRTYLVAMDPWATWAHVVIPDPAFRYRRILLPALASGLGLINGRPLLWLLTSLNALSFAAAAAIAALMARLRSLAFWAPLAVVLNIGIWLSLQVTSPDALAFAFALAGLLAGIGGRNVLAIGLLALAALSKETYALVPMSMAAYLWIREDQPRRAIAYASSVTPVGLWSVFLAVRMPNPFETADTLTWPFFGIFHGAQSWALNDTRDIAFLFLTGAAVVLSFVVIGKRPRSLWSWLIIPWLILASISSHWVWGFGNNPVRVFLPILTFVTFAFLDRGDEVSLVVGRNRRKGLTDTIRAAAT
jgi:hypothetical protein